MLLPIAVSITSTSCNAPKKAPETWTALPQVPWNRVTNGNFPLPEDGYQLMLTAPTTGLFPANLAVTRVAMAEGDQQAPAPTLLADPRNEFLQWNRAFDDQMAVSEVFPIDQRDLGGGPADPEQILAAFRALHARVGLIYAVNEISPYQSEMFGALYDTQTSSVLATIHAKAQSAPMNENNAPINPWETDSRALVRKKFEKYAYTAIYELIQQDQPVRSEPPEGWIPAGPIKPVEWPPRQRRIP